MFGDKASSLLKLAYRVIAAALRDKEMPMKAKADIALAVLGKSTVTKAVETDRPPQVIEFHLDKSMQMAEPLPADDMNNMTL